MEAEPEEPPPVYSPTSPASDVPDNELEGSKGDKVHSTPPAKQDAGAGGSTVVCETGKSTLPGLNNKDSEDEPRAVPVWVPTEEHTTEGRATSEPNKVSTGILPELVTGSRLDKTVQMHPGHWIKIGRNPKAHLMCNNAGVSRNQVSVKWDPHEKRVEMRLEAKSGTLVNGKEIRESRRLLEHGDRIRIVGKGQTFDFLLDLRPVGLGSGDPRYRARVAADKTKTGPTQRRDTLRAQMQHLQKAINNFEEKAFQREQEYYEIATRRRLREQEQAERKDQHKHYIEDAKVQMVVLDEGRKDWLSKLDDLHAGNEKETAPVIETTSQLQDKLEKLHLKKDELARQIHPEQYAVADIALSINQSEDEGSRSQRSRSQHSRPRPATNDAEGEEDAFAGLSGLQDRRVGESSDDEMLQPKAPKKDAAVDSGSDEADEFLKRSHPEDAATDAKRPRLDEPADAGPVWSRGGEPSAVGSAADGAAHEGEADALAP